MYPKAPQKVYVKNTKKNPINTSLVLFFGFEAFLYIGNEIL